ncbi:MAG: ketoacyl-ACP synthase III [Planctomycetes bacterium]|nr:ketoacyl-ACP synthase III [Planctomycetota bacterium]
MAARIVDIATYLPELRETVEQLRAEHPDWPVDKIADKTGIVERRIVGAGQTAGDMAAEAAKNLFATGKTAPSDVDYLVYCTQSPDYPLPSTACVLQHQLGIPCTSGAFDFQLGCSGYVYGLQLANALIAAGDANRVLLLTADTYTRYVHPADRTVRMLFGDAATATLIERDASGGSAIGPFVVGTDGQGAANLVVAAGGGRLPRSDHTARAETDAAGCIRTQDNLFMDGQAVFSFALGRVPELVEATLSRARLSIDQIDWFVYHQANRFMLENLAVCSRIPLEKVVYHLKDVGNTVSSSIPLAMRAYADQGRLTPGQRLMLIGFGVGYSWGACIVEWR